ncbi:MAG: response regulator [Ignavibacteria bacterium]|nr:response regulator [Ignavibacteria bacterium]
MEEQKFLVLLVDDDDLFRHYTEFILKKYLDIDVVSIKYPNEALDFLSTKVPDLILLDMGLPEMDGYTFLKKIRGIESLQEVPVIPCTAFASKELFASLLKLNISDYILKPTTDRILIDKVKKVMNISRQNLQKESKDDSKEQ